MQQAGEILRGERAPSREFTVDAERVTKVRLATGLSQAKFASIIDVPVSTLQNWEQGRRVLTGPARALFRALGNDPKHVMKALSARETRVVTATSMTLKGAARTASAGGARGKPKKVARPTRASGPRNAMARG
jgi:putative transcriptional regulator